MHPFTCCTRQDDSKYLHGPCGCPKVTVNCESEQVDATLCGFSEYTNPSTPPLKYRKETDTQIAFGSVSGPGDGESCPRYYDSGCVFTFNNVFTSEYSVTDCSISTSGTSNQPLPLCSVNSGGTSSSVHTPLGLPTTSTKKVSGDRYDTSFDCTHRGAGTGSLVSSNERTQELSIEDTEADAIARETPTAGTSCSSIWETRSTGFTFTKRTSEYTIVCSDLVVEYEYKVTPSIRKRPVVIGSYGDWEDVTLTPVTFTATAKTKTFPAVLLGDDGSGSDIIQGWEYEITGVTIEKTA